MSSDSQPAVLIRVVIDIVLLGLVAIPSTVFKFGNIEPTKRGFFCDDNSIKYPYHSSTISTPVLIVVSLFCNVVVIVICEAVQYYRQSKLDSLPSERVGRCQINKCVYTVAGYMWILGFGMFATTGITDIGKYTIGRLRPHFLDGCKPDIDLSRCEPGVLVTEFNCTQQNKEIFQDLRLSFPSGHASLSAYSMAFLVLYIQQRIPRFPISYLFKHILQLLAVLMAWFCALSRVMDNKHHWSDVLAGSLIGVAVALFCGKYISKSFRNPYTHGPYPHSKFVFHQSMTLNSDSENEEMRRRDGDTSTDVNAK